MPVAKQEKNQLKNIKIVIDGLLKNIERLNLSDQAVTNKASILLTLELTATIAYLGFIKDYLTLQSPYFLFTFLGIVGIITSCVFLMMAIFPRHFSFPCPLMNGEEEVLNSNELDFNKWYLQNLQSSFKNNNKIQTFKSNHYLRGIISFFVAVALIGLSHGQQIIDNSVNSQDQKNNEIMNIPSSQCSRYDVELHY